MANICTCPKCNGSTKSVAAMNYAETQLWNKSGRFSGSGVGIGTGGIGVGVGGGTYSESGTMSSKRAAKFNEPVHFDINMGPIITGFLVIVVLYLLPTMLSIMTAAVGGDSTSQTVMPFTTDQVTDLLKYVIPFIVLILFIINMTNYQKEVRRVEHLNNVVYPKQLERYNELRYCENCHILFDDKGNKENANEFGFDKLMNM